MIYLGADHAGFHQKEALKRALSARLVEFTDLGTESDTPVDYPLVVEKVIKAMDLKTDRAIILCGSGQGVAIAANKFEGIRAAVCWDEKVAKETREDNDSNVLALPSRYIQDEQAIAITKVWLATAFTNEERHKRRINEVTELERRER